MINILPNELIPVICLYLYLDGKKSFREVNKLIDLLTKKYTYAHIGNIFNFYISLDLSNNIDLNFFFRYVKKNGLIPYLYNLISESIFYKKSINNYKYKFYSYNNVKIGVLHRFINKTKKECIETIRKHKQI